MANSYYVHANAQTKLVTQMSFLQGTPVEYYLTPLRKQKYTSNQHEVHGVAPDTPEFAALHAMLNGGNMSNSYRVNPNRTVGLVNSKIWPHVLELLQAARDRAAQKTLMVDGKPVHIPAYGRIASLHDLHARLSANPDETFPRVLMRLADEPGHHEIQDEAQLREIIDHSLDVHNTAHNARHLAEPEIKVVVDEFLSKFDLFETLDDWNNQDKMNEFTVAQDAFNALDYDAIIAKYMGDEHKVRTPPVTIKAKKARARVAIQQAAANRIAFLTGTETTWLMLLNSGIDRYNVSGLVRIVEEAGVLIEGAEEDSIADVTNAIIASISTWIPDLGVTLGAAVTNQGTGRTIILRATAPCRVELSSENAIIDPDSVTFATRGGVQVIQVTKDVKADVTGEAEILGQVYLLEATEVATEVNLTVTVN